MSVSPRAELALLWSALALALCGLATFEVRAEPTTSTPSANDEDLLDGFDDPTPSSGPLPSSAAGMGRGGAAGDGDGGLPSWIEMRGAFTIGSAYSFAQSAPREGQADYRGLSRLRLGAEVEVEVDLPLSLRGRVSGRAFRDLSYRLKRRSEFTHEVLDRYEAEIELGETWIEGSLASLDLRFGRQVIAWGSSETLRVLDVLSPLDQREPGLLDLRDLRLPVLATRVGYFRGPLELSGVAVHESRFDKSPPFGSDFFPFDRPPPGEIRPANGGSDTEYGVALSARLSRLDASLHFARYFDDRPHLDRDSGLLEHARLTLVGASVDVPLGALLVRAEAARIRGLEVAASRRDLARTDLLIGLDYAGLTDASLSLELVARRLHGYESALERAPDSTRRTTYEGALRYTARYWNDRLRLTSLLVVRGRRAQDGVTLRLSVDYDLRDDLTVTAGVLVFEEGHLPPFEEIDDNDRIFLNLRYSY